MIYKDRFSIIIKSLVIGFIVLLFFHRHYSSELVSDKLDTYKSYQEIGLADTIILKDLLSTLLIDIRPPTLYRRSHIPKAINITLDQLRDIAGNILLQRLTAAANIIIYSQTYSNKEIVEFVSLLEPYNLKSVKVYRPGYNEWKACNLPLDGLND